MFCINNMFGTQFILLLHTMVVYTIVCFSVAFGDSEILDDEPRNTSVLEGSKLEASLFDECMLKEDIVFCFQNTMLDTVEALTNRTSIPLLDGVFLVKSPSDNSSGPTSRGRYSIQRLIWQKLYDLFTARSIHIDLAEREVGRNKKKNLYEYGLVALLVAAFLLPLKFQGLAVVAGMALVISKIALALVTTAGLKQLASQQQKQEEPWMATSSSHRRTQLVNPHLVVYKTVEPAR